MDGRLWTDDHILRCHIALWRVKFSKSFAPNHLEQFPLMLHERDSKESEPCLKPVLISLTDLLGECRILAQNSYYASRKYWDHGGMSASIEPTQMKREAIHLQAGQSKMLKNEKTSYIDIYYIYIYGCFLKWWYPQNTPKWSFLVGKPNGCWVPPYFYTYFPCYLGLPVSASCLIHVHPSKLSKPSMAGVAGYIHGQELHRTSRPHCILISVLSCLVCFPLSSSLQVGFGKCGENSVTFISQWENNTKHPSLIIVS